MIHDIDLYTGPDERPSADEEPTMTDAERREEQAQWQAENERTEATATGPLATYTKEGSQLWEPIFTTERLYNDPIPEGDLDKLDVDSVFATDGELTLYPSPVRVTVARVNLKRTNTLKVFLPIASKDYGRPAMTGVYFDADKGDVVATDGFILVKMPTARCLFPVTETQIIHPWYRAIIDEKYPDWRKIIPPDGGVDTLGIFGCSNLLTALTPIVECIRYLRSVYSLGSICCARIIYGDRVIYIDPTKLQTALKALIRIGVELVEVRNGGEHALVQFRDVNDPETYSMVMPLKHVAQSRYVWSTIIATGGKP